MKLKQSGLTYAELAEIHGVSRQRIQQVIVQSSPRIGVECERCHVTKTLQRHHVSYEPEVVITLCRKCHLNETHGRDVGRWLEIAGSTATVWEVTAFAKAAEITYGRAWRFLKVHGYQTKRTVTLRPPKNPWTTMDWRLPTDVLAHVWKVNPSTVSRMRKQLGGPAAFSLVQCRKTITETQQSMIAEEIKKRDLLS